MSQATLSLTKTTVANTERVLQEYANEIQALNQEVGQLDLENSELLKANRAFQIQISEKDSLIDTQNSTIQSLGDRADQAELLAQSTNEKLQQKTTESDERQKKIDQLSKSLEETTKFHEAALKRIEELTQLLKGTTDELSATHEVVDLHGQKIKGLPDSSKFGDQRRLRQQKRAEENKNNQ